jgi:hypothetical protein
MILKNKVIISGCSYSAYAGFGISYGDSLKRYGYDVFNMAWNGQSNESIIKKIYDYVSKENVTDSLIICQLTYTHRIGWFHHSVKRWVDYQPKYIQTIPEYNVETDNIKVEILMDEAFMEGGSWKLPKDVTKEEYSILTDMYKTWLKYVYDEDGMFNYLLYKIDTLKAYVESTGNKIEFIYWPNIENEKQKEEIKNRNFLNIDNEYSMLKWSTKNKLIDITSHLHKEGHLTFADILDNKITKNYPKIQKVKKSFLI